MPRPRNSAPGFVHRAIRNDPIILSIPVQTKPSCEKTQADTADGIDTSFRAAGASREDSPAPLGPRVRDPSCRSPWRKAGRGGKKIFFGAVSGNRLRIPPLAPKMPQRACQKRARGLSGKARTDPGTSHFKAPQGPGFPVFLKIWGLVRTFTSC